MTDWADEAADRIYSHASVYELDDIANILRGIRNDALEEAARYMETGFALGVGDYAAVKIRSLKEKI